MNILHYSDKTDTSFPQLYNDCDLLISTGDLQQTDFICLELQPTKKPAFGIYGNHDSGTYMEALGIINLHLQIYEWQNMTWGGFQGCPRYKVGDFQYSEEEAEHFYQTFPRVDVLLLHAGGKDLLDDPSDSVHIGSPSIAKYIQEKKPRYVFCGHQYSHAEMTVGETKIYRSYGARSITVE